ncbi:MAG: hypothetical protein ACSHXI_05725 [Hoeflea sp.]|uniref:hypothetical protein n=1 Tax=Hoeflea sp. TaxID=1940281 RepID=UPI003EF1C42B
MRALLPLGLFLVVFQSCGSVASANGASVKSAVLVSDSSQILRSTGTCSFGGKGIEQGQAVVAFLHSSAPFGEECIAEYRKCDDGQLSGSFPSTSCAVDAPKSCLFNGKLLAHGQKTNAFFHAESPSVSGVCTGEQRTCNDGKLSGSAKHTSCATPYAKKVSQQIVNQKIFSKPSYDYAPAVIHDNGIYRMYWCAGVSGDYITHAQATSLKGPWHSSTSNRAGSYDVSLKPSIDGFDNEHVCDPNIIKVGKSYYLYYGGARKGTNGTDTQIGLATSTDGVHFARQNNGQAIVKPARTNPNGPIKYGAGQPAVLYIAPYWYLSFTDTTGSGANPVNGAGQFSLRSKTALFNQDVEELTAKGWVRRTGNFHTSEFSFAEATSIDWSYDKLTRKIIVVSNRTFNKTSLLFFDKTNFEPIGTTLETTPSLPRLNSSWSDGSAIVSNADKTMMPRKRCRDLPIYTIHAVQETPGYPENLDTEAWDLRLSKADFMIDDDCSDVARPYPEMSLIVSPGLPLALIVQGSRLQFQSGGVPEMFKKSQRYSIDSEAYHEIPYIGSIVAGATVLGAKGRPAAFVSDRDELWPVSCNRAIVKNGSSISMVSAQRFDQYTVRSSLICN